MRRRSLLSLPFALAAMPVLAQTDPGFVAPPPDYAPREPRMRDPSGEARPPRRKMALMRYDELSPAQRRRAQMAMARDGERDVPPEEARRRWDATPERQRRAQVRRVAQANPGRRGNRAGREGGDMMRGDTTRGGVEGGRMRDDSPPLPR